MSLSDWLRPPRHLLALFAAVTLVPAVALVWLGWQVISQDRVVGQQQRRARLEASADRIASAIARDLDRIAHDLPRWLIRPPESMKAHALVVRLGPRGVEARAGAPLLFVPTAEETVQDPTAPVWNAGEALEARQDLVGALSAFRAVGASRDPETRAGALVRIAGDLRRLGRLDDALAEYRALARETTAHLIGQPADLVARAAECDVLAALGQHDELARSARTLAADLTQGRWPIDRATYEFRVSQIQSWISVPDAADQVALAGALEAFVSERRGRPSNLHSGTWSIWQGDGSTLVVWQSDGPSLVVLAAGPSFLDAAWRDIWSSENVTVTWANPTNPSNSTNLADPPVAVRRSADTGLPWTLRVASAAPDVEDAASVRGRQLMAAGLAVLVFLIPAGGYVVLRAVQREMAVARLQADFVSAVSHEFRTPLTAMSHLTERLQRDPAIADDRRRQYYEALARDTLRLRRFVETLLDFGRMEAGASPVRLEPADLGDVVAGVMNEFRADAAAGRHPIALKPEGALPPVRLDRESFGHAVWNLLDNAAKYSAADAAIEVELGRDGACAFVRVTDHGPGIPPDERRQIFQKFIRGAAPRASGIRGTGIGLAMVEQIAREHGGEVRLDSNVGRGSTFTIVLPVA